VTCHQLGFDAEVGHVKMWNAETWGIRLLELTDRYHFISRTSTSLVRSLREFLELSA
jgi:hypothetical protein